MRFYVWFFVLFMLFSYFFSPKFVRQFCNFLCNVSLCSILNIMQDLWPIIWVKRYRPSILNRGLCLTVTFVEIGMYIFSIDTVYDLHRCCSCFTVEVYGHLSTRRFIRVQVLPTLGLGASTTVDYSNSNMANLDDDIVDIKVCHVTFMNKDKRR